MKLRLHDASVRLRLRRSEVEQFRSAGAISAVIRFPAGGALTYRLVSGSGPAITASFSANLLDVQVPTAAAEAWCSGDQVGIYGHAGDVEILVEKDFRRTAMPSPDDADRYPNPRAACAPSLP